METLRHSALRLLAVLMTIALAEIVLGAAQSPSAVSSRPCRVVNETQGKHFPPDNGDALAAAIASATPDDQLGDHWNVHGHLYAEPKYRIDWYRYPSVPNSDFARSICSDSRHESDVRRSIFFRLIVAACVVAAASAQTTDSDRDALFAAIRRGSVPATIDC